MYNGRDKYCIQNFSGRDHRHNLANNIGSWGEGGGESTTGVRIYDEEDRLERNKKNTGGAFPPL